MKHIFLFFLSIASLNAFSYHMELTDKEWIFICEQNAIFASNGICRVHNIKMVQISVPIEYGLPTAPNPEGPSEAYRAIFFPNARSCVNGGCVRLPGRDSENIFICEECKTVEKKYLKQVWESAQK